jgi:hypothetical protein
VQRGLSSLSPSPTIDIRPWRGPRLRAGVDGENVGDNYELDYAPAIRGKEVEAPLSEGLGQGLKFWLPEDRWVGGCGCVLYVYVWWVGPARLD